RPSFQASVENQAGRMRRGSKRLFFPDRDVRRARRLRDPWSSARTHPPTAPVVSCGLGSGMTSSLHEGSCAVSGSPSVPIAIFTALLACACVIEPPVLEARVAEPDSIRGAPSENAFPVVLGSFSTTLAGSTSGRNHNIRL